MAWNGYGWRPYVPVAQRRAKARKKMDSLRKKGVDIQPVEIEGRKIAKSFWGEAWCKHLESFSDYENRLPRGRTYVRNGSVCHLEIRKGEILAKVAGSEIYSLRIQIKTLPKKKWTAIKQRCAGQVGSLLELLQGKLSSHVMEVVTDHTSGLFPLPAEVSLCCDCPDWAIMCKHVAGALYGVGARLDQQPELLFKLRAVDHTELIEADAEAAISDATSRGKSKRLSDGDLSDVFGIDLDSSGEPATVSTTRKKSPIKVTKGKRKKAVATKKRAPRKGAKKTVKKKLRKTAGKKTMKGATAKATKTPTSKKATKRKARRPRVASTG